MRLLCIANPAAYQGAVTDIPLSYARLAAHPDMELFHADTQALVSPGQKIHATRISPGFLPDEFGRLSRRKYTLFPPEHFDLAFCRTLKPFPEGYLQRLIQWSTRLRFVNDPAGIKQQLEPAFFLEAVGGFAPPSVITADATVARDFLAHHEVIVAKRGNSCGGRGVYRISPTPTGSFSLENIVDGKQTFANCSKLFAHLTHGGKETLLLMRYLPRVGEGDKRIVVVDGQIFGSYLRTSSNGHWIQNVSTGGRCELVRYSSEEQAVIDATYGHYKKVGIHILGYDLLRDDSGGWTVSEINAGNIGGLFRIEYLGIPGVTDRFVSWLHAFRERIAVL
jgi:glutathione synthase/RimK-type ligase-like ATP-grasp enzyme